MTGPLQQVGVIESVNLCQLNQHVGGRAPNGVSLNLTEVAICHARLRLDRTKS